MNRAIQFSTTDYLWVHYRITIVLLVNGAQNDFLHLITKHFGQKGTVHA